MRTCSVVIITYNEEAMIERCITSANKIADEIIIVDSGSTDNTKKIAAHLGAKVIETTWQGFVTTKNFALTHASCDLIFSIDCDEIVSDELIHSIMEIKHSSEQCLYSIRRKTFYLGAFLNHAWQPDVRPRIFPRGTAQWSGGSVHETLLSSLPVKTLNGFLYHYSYRDLEDQYQKTLRYARLAASDMIAHGKRVSLFKVLFSPLSAWFKTLFLKGGILDGWRGISVASSTLFVTFLKYLFVYEASHERTHK